MATERRETVKLPTVPANRVLRQGELPCRICGSGNADHGHRDHTFERVKGRT